MHYSEMFDQNVLRPCLFEINLDAIAHNITEIQRYIGSSVKLFAVLKCNAYGFGLKEVSQCVEASSAYAIAVADLSEAVFLRQNGVTKPILVYANSLPSAAFHYVKHNLIPTVDNLEYAIAYAEASTGPMKIFVKVDTGRYRNGIPLEDVAPFCQELLKFERLSIEGIYAHLDRFDIETDEKYVRWQFSKYADTIRSLEENGIHIPIKIAASSAEVLQYPDMCLNAVDVGKIIYGIYYPKSAKNKINLQPAFKSLKTQLIAIKNVSSAHPFASQLNFRLKENMVIGIVPFGWGDGFPKAPLNEGEVLIRGKRVKVIGSMYVEHARVDLTDLLEAKIGDEMVIIGKQGNQEISLEEVADVCKIGGSALTRTAREHIPRLFYKEGKPYKLNTL